MLIIDQRRLPRCPHNTNWTKYIYKACIDMEFGPESGERLREHDHFRKHRCPNQAATLSFPEVFY